MKINFFPLRAQYRAAVNPPAAAVNLLPRPLSDYEQTRQDNILRNKAFLEALGIQDSRPPASSSSDVVVVDEKVQKKTKKLPLQPQRTSSRLTVKPRNYFDEVEVNDCPPQGR